MSTFPAECVKDRICVVIAEAGGKIARKELFARRLCADEFMEAALIGMVRDNHIELNLDMVELGSVWHEYMCEGRPKQPNDVTRRRKKRPKLPSTEKRCTRCKVVKPIAEFYASHGTCKCCTKLRNIELKSAREAGRPRPVAPQRESRT